MKKYKSLEELLKDLGFSGRVGKMKCAHQYLFII